MGNNVIPQATGAAFAELKSADDAWPTDSARKRGGYQFLGYRLDKSGRPTFEYRIADVRIDDKPEPVSGGANPQLRRTFTFEAAKPPKNLWLASPPRRRSKKPATVGTSSMVHGKCVSTARRRSFARPTR